MACYQLHTILQEQKLNIKNEIYSSFACDNHMHNYSPLKHIAKSIYH